MVVRLLEIVRGAQDLLRLLDGVFGLAGHEQSRQGNIFKVVLVAREPNSKLVVVDRSCIERLDGPVMDRSAIIPFQLG